MTRPSREIGQLELLVRLRLEVAGAQRLGLLAAYAASPPGGEATQDEEEEEGDGASPRAATVEDRATSTHGL